MLPRETIPPSAAFDSAEQLDKGHGWIEWRKLEASAELTDYLDWPGLAQVCRITRSRLVRGKESREVVYAITSLPPEKAGAAFLLALSRAHWGIENRLHLVRDVSFAEDACRVRSGAAPQTLAAFRNTVLTLMRRRSGKITEEIEHFRENRQHATVFKPSLAQPIAAAPAVPETVILISSMRATPPPAGMASTGRPRMSRVAMPTTATS